MSSNSSRLNVERPPFPTRMISGTGPMRASYALMKEQAKKEKISKICTVTFLFDPSLFMEPRQCGRGEGLTDHVCVVREGKSHVNCPRMALARLNDVVKAVK